MKHMLSVVAQAMTLIASATGCVSTSAVFQRTVKPGVDNVVADMRDYTAHADWDLNHDGSVDVIEKGEQIREGSATDALAASVADPSRIELTDVSAAWSVVKPKFIKYVNEDPTLANPVDKQTILNTASDIDELIRLETDRQNSLAGWFGQGGDKISAALTKRPATRPE